LKQEFEFAYLASRLAGLAKPRVPVVPYHPQRRQPPTRTLPVVSAWEGIQDILADLIERFQVDTSRCLEFGVEYGFSTVALSSFFDSVLGVDTFQGDRHTINSDDIFEETSARLAPYSNITLVRSDYRDFIQQDHGTFGLIHVDIIHTFADTYACGLWSARRSKCTLFHDTESFPQVKQAVREIARETGKRFYNFEENWGLGIVA
jgi:hypothetical protein